MSDLTASKVEIEVYLEGVKVPVSSISINEALGSPPSCTINFPAHSGALRILPGTIVHVFGLVEMLPGLGQVKKLTKQQVLLFEGEIAGQSYSKTPTQRMVSLTAQSLIHKWSQVYMHSADMLADKLLLNALYVYQEWEDLDTYDAGSKVDQGAPTNVSSNADGTPKSSSTTNPQQPTEDGENKYLRFDYTHTLEGMNDLEFWIIQAWSGAAADTEAKERGDWMPFFLDIIKHLEYLNLYYGMFSKMYRLADTNFIFPNIAVKAALEQFLSERTFLQTSTKMEEKISMIDIILQVLNMINYIILIPAAPTYMVHPYTDLNRAPHNGLGDFGEVPMRTIMLPDTKFSVPAKCNVIFPDEVQSLDFTRNMSGEYTRMFCGASPTNLKVDASNLGDFQGSYVVPGLPFVNASDSDEDRSAHPAASPYHLDFTPEETYRGVHPIRTHYNGLEEGFLRSLIKSPGDTPADEHKLSSVWAPTSPAGQVAYNTALISYYTTRYSARQCSISAAWNPFRVVGLPALFFDLDGSPSVMGTLVQHTTTIDAQGSATSDLVLGLPHVFYDIEGLDNIDLILPNSVKTTREAKIIASMDKEVLKHNAMEADALPWINAWYDNQWYGSDYIGRDVYSLITHGTRSLWTKNIDDVSKHDSAWTNLDAVPEPAFSEEVRERYNNTAKWSPNIDSSIFSFVRNSASAKFNIPTDVDAIFAPAEDGSDSTQAITAKRIGYSIRQLKRSYYDAKSNGRLKSFIISTTNRNLVPKNRYWKFIGIGLTNTDTDPIENPFDGIARKGLWTSYYRPTITDKSSPYYGHVWGMTTNDCKEILHAFYKNELSWEEAIKSFKLHPFVEKRRDHVLTMTTLVAKAYEPRIGR